MGRTHRSVGIKENFLESFLFLRIARIGRFFPRIGGRIGTDRYGSVNFCGLLPRSSRAAPTWRPCGSHVALMPSHALPCSRMLCHARAVRLFQALSCSVMLSQVDARCLMLSRALSCSRLLAHAIVHSRALSHPGSCSLMLSCNVTRSAFLLPLAALAV